MIDLVVLLSLALLSMVVLGLLVAGFVWVPWLIGLVLMGLFIVLLRLANATDRQMALEISTETEQTTPPPATPVETHSEPASTEPTMLYRGAKYTAGHSANPQPTPSSAVLTGKYRGTPWQRPQS